MTLIDWTSKSKNYTQGREGRKVKYIAIHWVAVGTGESAAKYLLNNANNTSAHYIIEDDKVWLVVHPENTAHAVGDWVKNTESISIEHSATPDRPASELTYKTSANLIKDLCGVYGLEINDKTIKPHSFFSATACPGTIDIRKLIEYASQGNTESPEAKKIAELEKEKDKFEALSIKQAKTIKTIENDAKEQEKKLEALQKERDVFHDLSERTSEEVKELKASVDQAVKLAGEWEFELKDKTTELKQKGIDYGKLKTKFDNLQIEKDILQRENQKLGALISSKKIFKYKNYSLVLIEDLK